MAKLFPFSTPACSILASCSGRSTSKTPVPPHSSYLDGAQASTMTILYDAQVGM
ncbi:hypothetical protein CGMCC3_g4176 [Colletotrichum fructicola]|uniref:Uncharacterized protein n=1 Tax=Colletotrichum chrysophilum TaxID=1836956 RepID=A0AAD9A757_9PEZI|nr:uncharacterized protein CGMCC3_g4176 [Colletotrichum fructicola]KAE9579900.1 hypothetical protein CGMCC3_g4176 [Colletotrichum fructicola]KAH9228142.1 hypothetical protein K456DRAFT_57418 [Colletotrichum gloeosporioides 23]KAK1841645.1 hypothetical protein CCHR01_15713 [Colletotrichum chrysophilum]